MDCWKFDAGIEVVVFSHDDWSRKEALCLISASAQFNKKGTAKRILYFRKAINPIWRKNITREFSFYTFIGLALTLHSYTPCTLRACCSQSEFRLLKISQSSKRALFLYNCTLRNFECLMRCLHLQKRCIGLIYLLHGYSYFVGNITLIK